MTLHIARIWQPTEIEWDDAWRSCPYATFFHSREWAEIWADYSYGKITPVPLGVSLSDGTQVILPFSKEKIFKGFATQYISSPAGTFGGWLANVSLGEAQQILLMQIITKRYANLLWRFNPYETVLVSNGSGDVTMDETHALDLSGGFEKVYYGWTKGHASAARKAGKARKAGVNISLAQSRGRMEDLFPDLLRLVKSLG